MKRLAVSLLLVAGCAHPPPPKESAAKLNACGELPAQSDALAADERVVKVELRSKLDPDVDLTGACLNYAGHRIPPEGGAAVRLAGLKGGGVLVFAIHVKKKTKSAKFHLHMAAEHFHGRTDTAILDFNSEYVPDNLPNGSLKVTLVPRELNNAFVLDAQQSD